MPTKNTLRWQLDDGYYYGFELAYIQNRETAGQGMQEIVCYQGNTIGEKFNESD